MGLFRTLEIAGLRIEACLSGYRQASLVIRFPHPRFPSPHRLRSPEPPPGLAVTNPFPRLLGSNTIL